MNYLSTRRRLAKNGMMFEIFEQGTRVDINSRNGISIILCADASFAVHSDGKSRSPGAVKVGGAI